MKTLTKKTEKKKTVAVALTLGGNERKKRETNERKDTKQKYQFLIQYSPKDVVPELG